MIATADETSIGRVTTSEGRTGSLQVVMKVSRDGGDHHPHLFLRPP